MELRLRPEHPDVSAKKRQIAELERKAQQEAQDVVSTPGQAPRPVCRRQLAREARVRDVPDRDREARSPDRDEGSGRGAAAPVGLRLPAARRGGARPRVRADRSDARLRHAAEAPTPACWPRRKSRRFPPTSNGSRSASSSRSSTRRGCRRSRSARTACKITLAGAGFGLMLGVVLGALPRVSRHLASQRGRNPADAGAAGARRHPGDDRGQRARTPAQDGRGLRRWQRSWPWPASRRWRSGASACSRGCSDVRSLLRSSRASVRADAEPALPADDAAPPRGA